MCTWIKCDLLWLFLRELKNLHSWLLLLEQTVAWDLFRLLPIRENPLYASFMEQQLQAKWATLQTYAEYF